MPIVFFYLGILMDRDISCLGQFVKFKVKIEYVLLSIRVRFSQMGANYNRCNQGLILYAYISNKFIKLIVLVFFCCCVCFTEIELGTKCIVEMEKQQTILHNPPALDKLER